MEMVLNNLWAAELRDGTLDLNQGYISKCYLIAERIDDPEIIRRTAHELTVSGCVCGGVYGRYAALWTEAAEKLAPAYPNFCRMPICEAMDDILNVMRDERKVRPIIPVRYYLLYDDADVCARVIAGLKAMEENDCF